MTARINSESVPTPLAVVSVLIAIIVWSIIPTRPDSYEALSSTGQIGTRLAGRNIAVTVHRVCASHQLVSLLNARSGSVYRSRGYWVVADVTFETITEHSGMRAQLHSDGIVTGQRNIGMPGIPAVPDVGLQYRQALTFEVPELSSQMSISFMNFFADSRTGLTMDSPLDSRIDIVFPSSRVELMRNLSVARDGTLE